MANKQARTKETKAREDSDALQISCTPSSCTTQSFGDHLPNAPGANDAQGLGGWWG